MQSSFEEIQFLSDEAQHSEEHGCATLQNIVLPTSRLADAAQSPGLVVERAVVPRVEIVPLHPVPTENMEVNALIHLLA